MDDQPASSKPIISLLSTIAEINRRNGDSDGVRRECIRRVEAITKRPLLVYATAFLDGDKPQYAKDKIFIHPDDVVGLRDVIQVIPGSQLDVLIHSPGGYPEAAENIVELLRSRFTSLRFIVPHKAKSAATLICCAADELLMDEVSELGPIDPQLQVTRSDGAIISAPAQAIERQFDKARDRLVANPKEISVWLPILQTFGPSLLAECETASKLGIKLAQDWLNRWMLNGRPEVAAHVAEYLSDSSLHLTHGRRIGIDQLRQAGMDRIIDMRSQPELRDAVWQLYLAIRATFTGTAAIKLIEYNEVGVFIQMLQIIQVNNPTIQPGQIPPGGPAQGLPPQRTKKNRKHH